MINLKEIEQTIDNLLASETEDSLRSWLKDQRNPDIYLGEGEFIPSGLKGQHIEIASSVVVTYVYADTYNEEVENCIYTMAA